MAPVAAVVAVRAVACKAVTLVVSQVVKAAVAGDLAALAEVGWRLKT